MGLLFAHDQERDCAVGDLGSVPGGDGAGAAIEHGFQFSKRLGGLIRARAVVLEDGGGRLVAIDVNRANLFSEPGACGGGLFM